MKLIGTLGPEGTYSWRAAVQYDPDAKVVLFETISKVYDAFEEKRVQQAIVPIYNTIDKEIPESVNRLKNLPEGFWIVDNVTLPIEHTVGSLDHDHEIKLLLSKDTVFRQCERYISQRFPNVAMKPISSTAQGIDEIIQNELYEAAVIASLEAIEAHGLVVRDKNIVKNNRTRFAVLGQQLPAPTGYDGTIIVTTPLRDRVGLLHDILEEFESRNINLLDLRSDTDEETQRLFFYIELEGHIQDSQVNLAIEGIRSVIEDPNSVKVLGSFPRVDLRQKKITRVGFIGTGPMSRWFQERLEREGITTYLTGRTSEIRPEAMIPTVDVIIPCVPISAGKEVLRKYAALLRPGQALITLAGEATETLKTALRYSPPNVEVMCIHNLWGPKASNMKNKNVIIIKTERSGELCQEFENFLYKHGAKITHDLPDKHNLMMGICQKLPSAISVALASVLRKHVVTPQDIQTHSTLTSIYPILTMSRIHAQPPKTYAEILTSNIEGTEIIEYFQKELQRIKEFGEQRDLMSLETIMKLNSQYLGQRFLNENLELSRKIDGVLSRS